MVEAEAEAKAPKYMPLSLLVYLKAAVQILLDAC
jgi:hypothetical protein